MSSASFLAFTELFRTLTWALWPSLWVLFSSSEAVFRQGCLEWARGETRARACWDWIGRWGHFQSGELAVKSMLRDCRLWLCLKHVTRWSLLRDLSSNYTLGRISSLNITSFYFLSIIYSSVRKSQKTVLKYKDQTWNIVKYFRRKWASQKHLDV